MKERKKERKKGNSIPTEVLWDPTPAAYLQIAPALTSPTLVSRKNLRTASLYRSFANKSLTDVLLGLARACLTLYPKPFLLLKGSSACSLFPDSFPTAVQSSLISVVQALHSLNRRSLLCLPLLHHQQTSVSVHPHLPQEGGYHGVPAKKLEEPGRDPLRGSPQLGAYTGS